MYDIQLVSIIVPISDEACSIMLLAEEIMEVMAETIYNYEIIFVNYGNDDQSWHTIIQLSNNFSVIRGINLEGGYGQTVALHSGFSFAKGDVIIAMDGNLRHDPAYMPVFLAYIERGYEVVCGLRKQQKPEPLLPSILTNIAQKVVLPFAGINLKYFGSTYKAYRRYLLENVDKISDTSRFLNSLIRKETRIMDVPIKFRTRKAIWAH